MKRREKSGSCFEGVDFVKRSHLLNGRKANLQITGSRGERYYTRNHYGTFVRVDGAG